MRAALPTLEIGQPAPDFRAMDSNGQTHRLSRYLGHHVVLEWTNFDCPYADKHYQTGSMQALQHLARQNGVAWFTVLSSAPGLHGHADGPLANEHVRQRKAVPWAVLLDPQGRLGRAYGALTTPHVFMLDPEGNLIYRGAVDDTPSAHAEDVEQASNFVRAALEQALAGQPITKPITRPYGSTVKYET